MWGVESQIFDGSKGTNFYRFFKIKRQKYREISKHINNLNHFLKKRRKKREKCFAIIFICLFLTNLF
jgi:hypothetical protein